MKKGSEVFVGGVIAVWEMLLKRGSNMTAREELWESVKRGSLILVDGVIAFWQWFRRGKCEERE